MSRNAAQDPDRPSAERVRRLVIWGFIIGVPWAPASVAMAMILSGNVG